MYGYGPCGHGCGHHHGQVYGPGWGYGRHAMAGREGRDEMIEDLEDYKAGLEEEIRRLEKRIGSLREKPAPE